MLISLLSEIRIESRTLVPRVWVPSGTVPSSCSLGDTGKEYVVGWDKYAVVFGIFDQPLFQESEVPEICLSARRMSTMIAGAENETIHLKYHVKKIAD